LHRTLGRDVRGRGFFICFSIVAGPHYTAHAIRKVERLADKMVAAAIAHPAFANPPT